MTAPVWTVEVAFADGPLVASPAWTDVTDYVREVSTRRGKSHEAERTQAGEATIRLTNTDRRFDPTYAAGAHYPNVKPMKQVRVRAVHSAVTYDLFRGHIEDWGQTWGGRPINGQGDAEVTVKAVDGFKLLNLLTLRSYSEQVFADEPLAYFRLTEGLGVPLINEGSLGADLNVTDTSDDLFAGHGPVAGPFDATSPQFTVAETGDTIPSPAHADLGLRDDVTLEAWLKVTNLAAMSAVDYGEIVSLDYGGASVASLQVYDTGALAFEHYRTAVLAETVATSAAAITANVWHHVAVTRSNRGVIFYVNGVEVHRETLARDPGAPTSNPHVSMGLDLEGVLGNVAVYGRALTAERIAAHAAATIDRVPAALTGAHLGHVLDAAGWPGGLRDLDTGLSLLPELDPTGSALAWLLAIAEEAEAGLLFMDGAGNVTLIDRTALLTTFTNAATFGDNAAEVVYRDLTLRYDDADLASRVSVEREGGTPQIAESSTAETAYGPRDLSVSGLKVATDLEALDRAYGLLGLYDEPGLRVESMDLDAGNNDTRITQQLVRELGDRVKVRRRPPGGGTMIEQDVLIEGIEHVIRPVGAQIIRTTFRLVPAPATHYWKLGDATDGLLGTTTTLAY